MARAVIFLVWTISSTASTSNARMNFSSRSRDLVPANFRYLRGVSAWGMMGNMNGWDLIDVLGKGGVDGPGLESSVAGDDASCSVLGGMLDGGFLWRVGGMCTFPLLQWMRMGWRVGFSKIHNASTILSVGITTDASLCARMGIWKWRIPFRCMNWRFSSG